MTSVEKTEIKELRSELHEYHIEVRQWIQRCTDCQERVAFRLNNLELEMNGPPGESEDAGVKGEIREIRTHIRGVKWMLAAIASIVGILGVVWDWFSAK